MTGTIIGYSGGDVHAIAMANHCADHMETTIVLGKSLSPDLFEFFVPGLAVVGTENGTPPVPTSR